MIEVFGLDLQAECILMMPACRTGRERLSRTLKVKRFENNFYSPPGGITFSSMLIIKRRVNPGSAYFHLDVEFYLWKKEDARLHQLNKIQED